MLTGRYGDPLNPWGDILAVAEAWCVSAKDAVLAMGVPTMVSRGNDINAFNAHRIYGPVMYSFLTTNWKFVWPTRGKREVHSVRSGPTCCRSEKLPLNCSP